MKLFKSKKGTTDTTIAVGVILAFIMIGTFLPFLDEEFNTTSGNYDVSELEGDIGQSSIGADTILFSILKVFFWTFTLPIYIEIILVFFKIYLAIYIYRNIRGVG